MMDMNIGTETDASTFILNNENDAPDAFTLSSPVGGAEVSTLTPTLDWPDVNDVDPLDVLSYTLYLDTPDPGIITIDVGTTSTYEISTSLDDNTTYYWKVKATDVAGLSRENTGGYQSFRVNTQNDLPTEFSLLAPENTSMVTDLTPTLLWNEPTDADDRSTRSIESYSVYIGTDNSFTGITPVVETSNSHTPSSNLTEDVLYYWKVVATDDDGGETTSATWSFWTNSTNSAPAQFTLVSPEEGDETSLTPTFTWTKSSDVDLNDQLSYTLSLGSNQMLLSDLEISGNSSSNAYSLSFDADDDYIDLGSNMDSDDQFSILTWVYLDEDVHPISGQRTFINKVNSDNGNKSIFLGSYQNKIGFTVLTGEQSNIMYGSDNQNGSLALTQTTLSTGWYHIGAVFTGDSMLVYINGELDPNVVVFENEGSVNDYNNSVWHIADVLGGSGRLSGKMSELSLWSKKLNQGDITTYYGATPSSDASGLLGLWKFNEGTGNQLTDYSGNGNNGTIFGAEWNTDVPQVQTISYTVSNNLTENTEYHWQVTAEDQSGATYTTPLQSFVVNAENDLPSNFALLSPGNTTMVTDLTPELHWDEPTDADLLGSIANYSVYISTDNAFTDVTPQVVATNTHTVSTDLTEDALYYWKVVATDDDGGETSSATWSFWTNSTNSAPAEFTLVSPEQDEETGLNTNI